MELNEFMAEFLPLADKFRKEESKNDPQYYLTELLSVLSETIPNTSIHVIKRALVNYQINNGVDIPPYKPEEV